MRTQRRIDALVGFGCSAALVATGAVLVASASSASAAPVSGGVLQLVATPGVLADSSMAPGDTIYWPITADLDASTSGELSLQIESSDALATDAGGLRLALASCPVAWDIPVDPTVAPTCQGGAGTVLVPDTAFANISPTRVWNLGNISAVSATPMMATISLPGAVPARLQGASAIVDFGFTALGDTEHASPSDPATPVLGETGVDPTGPLLLAIGLLVAGLTLARVRRAVAGTGRTGVHSTVRAES
jgi:hypothetical protein